MQGMLEVVDTPEGFLALQPEWNRLADRLGNPLLRHELFAALIEAQTGRHQLMVLVLRDSENAVRAIAPLQVRSHLGVKRLEFISHELHEPNGLLYTDEASLEVVVRAMLRTRLPIRLNRLNDGGAEIACIDALARGSRRFAYTDGGTILRVPLSTNFALVEKGITANRRHNLRRLRKRAEEFGQVEFVAAAPDLSNVDGYLDEVFRIEASGWKGRGRSAIFSDPEKQRFFRLYGRAAAQRGMLRIYIMKIAGATVAVRFAIAGAGRLWELKIGYDERWRSCSPGILMTHETLRHAGQEGLVFHEFLGMSADWERIWACEERRCRTLRYYPISVRSIACLGDDAVDIIGRRLGRTLSAMRKAKGKREASAVSTAA